jgi:hypothetical protein
MGKEREKAQNEKAPRVEGEGSDGDCRQEVKNEQREPGTGAHTCNPGYSGGRDQEDCGLRPACTDNFQALISKKNHKKGWWSGSR